MCTNIFGYFVDSICVKSNSDESVPQEPKRKSPPLKVVVKVSYPILKNSTHLKVNCRKTWSWSKDPWSNVPFPGAKMEHVNA